MKPHVIIDVYKRQIHHILTGLIFKVFAEGRKRHLKVAGCLISGKIAVEAIGF